jgi:hypothetical protein
MITTTYGPMDESKLRRETGVVDDEREHTEWVEYYLGDELVHRSAHVMLKQGLGVEGMLGSMG